MATSSTDRARTWRQNNPEKYKEHQRKSRQKYRKPCRVCGGPMLFPSPGAKYCSAECREFVRSRQEKEHRLRKREALWAYKTARGCDRCGYNKSGAALDFHHTDDNKERRFTVKAWGTPAFISEMEKCILLCANCHREEHHAEIEEEAILVA